MDQLVDVGGIDPRLGQRGVGALVGASTHARDLDELHLPLLVEAEQIGEGSADLDADPHVISVLSRPVSGRRRLTLGVR